MKKIFIYVAIAALALATACTTRNFPEIPADGDIVLSLRFGAPIQTRATTQGVGLENAVNSVDCFFYTDVTANPVYSFRDDNPTITQDEEGNNIYTVSLTAGEANPFGEGNVPDLNVLLNNKQCEVFAVFNSPTAITAAPLATIKTTALANSFAHEGPTAGTSTGSKWVVTLDEESAQHPKYFVMTGAQTLTRTGNSAITETVEMNRVAAKIAVDLKIRKSVTDASGKVWNPMLGGQQIRVYPQNVAKAAIIGGADATPTFPTNLDVFTYKEVVYESYYPEDYEEGGEHEGETDPGKVVIEGDDYVIASQQDFYTYPMTWTRGGDDEPFIKVIVPWSGEDGTTSQKEIYYKVMLPWTSIEANKYYKLTVNVSILGTEGEPEVTLEPLSALVVDWQGGGNINGTISAAKYLSVDRGVVTATSNYDTAEGRFDFYTATSGTSYAASDPVTVTIKEIKQKNLTSGDWEYLVQNGTANASEITKRGTPTQAYTVNEVMNQWVQKVGDNYLQIGHQLNATLTSTRMDVTPYYYTVILSLPEDIDPHTTAHPYGEYAKTVTFVQWPDVYVVADRNSNTPASATQGSNGKAGIFINGSNEATTTWRKGDYETWTGGTQNNYNLGGANGISNSAGNKNPDMYVLTISVSETYKIGDPRTAEVSMPEFRHRDVSREGRWPNYRYTYGDWEDNWAEGRWTEDNSVSNHVLTYYHPASSDNTSDMIAPKIRVASSYGVCTTGRTEEEARLRCATYQEDGIPAGRWRLPTMAEVKFISTLSALGRIPYLFGYLQTSDNFSNNAYYATANGIIRVNNGNKVATEYTGTTNQLSVRCVYDEWFWGDATTRPVSDKAQFTWGDRDY